MLTRPFVDDGRDGERRKKAYLVINPLIKEKKKKETWENRKDRFSSDGTMLGRRVFYPWPRPSFLIPSRKIIQS